MASIRSQEQLYASLQRGMEATRDLTLAKPLAAERREELIAEAIRKFRSLDKDKPYTPMDAFVFVARLSENAEQVERLERVESDGRRDGNRLQTQL